MITWGVSALSHDAAISVISGQEILFAAHAERYSRIKNDPYLNYHIIKEALEYGYPHEIVWYERPLLKKTRQLYSRQFSDAFSTSDIPSKYLKIFGITGNISYVDHHISHVAAGYYTSEFENCAAMVIDAIGEWNTISLWKIRDGYITKLKTVNYPNSLGLLYSVFTKRCGFKPNEEEYIMMGAAAYGDNIYEFKILREFIKEHSIFSSKNVHRGIGNFLPDVSINDIAASIQSLTEHYIDKISKTLKEETNDTNLIYMGGTALNCVANSLLTKDWDNIWIMPNPGDAGSSLGCAAYVNGRKLNWKGPYLGTNIDREYPIDDIIKALMEDGIVGVANGRAEFGPRALGNRSLLADPTVPGIKNKVNEIKKRQKFRPFAPAIPENIAHDFFDMPCNKSPYMQYVSTCKYPYGYPSIIHIDNTSRVQTVSERDHPMFLQLLTEYERITGCPMLLNTSLNIKGEPLVNTIDDGINFSEKYGVKVF